MQSPETRKLGLPEGGQRLRPAAEQVVALAKAGDEAAWRELFEANAGRLHVWLRSRPTGDVAADYDDIAAEAWLTAAQKIADFSGNSDDFSGWLFGIARNIARNAQRRTLRRATDPVATASAADGVWGAVADATPRVDDADWTRRLLARLPPREAEVLACIDVVGLDVAAASQALGLSAGAVRVSRHRGLKRLRKLMNAQPPLPYIPTTCADAVPPVESIDVVYDDRGSERVVRP